LFQIESGNEDQVLKDVKKVEGVDEAYISYGVYDLAVIVRADSMDDLKDVISNRLRQISEVRSTISLLLIEE
jgi:DNA-binding Lrp family transcriptional regulator